MATRERACKDCGTEPTLPNRARCRSCINARRRQQYRQRSAEQSAVAAARVQARRQLAREWVAAYLHEHPCSSCGEQDIILLDFDHLDPGTKRRSVSCMVSTGHSLKAVQEEVAKCRVLCVACHRYETAQQQRWWVLEFA